ncbi:MAG: hypothetical protein LBT98_00250 [Puniceicoccales bacterium]|nr:hypothetical protein [Puniceicoccales bacterium]
MKALLEMGFCQELELDGELVPTPAHVFVKYEVGGDPAAIRDQILDKIEPFNGKDSEIKTYVIVTEDLALYLIGEIQKQKEEEKGKKGK